MSGERKTSIRDQPVIKAEAGSEFRIAREMIEDYDQSAVLVNATSSCQDYSHGLDRTIDEK